MFLKNKLFIILLLFFIIVFSFVANSFAFVYNGTNGDSYDFPGFPIVGDSAYYIVFYTDGASGSNPYDSGYYFAYVTYDSGNYKYIDENDHIFTFDENPYLYHLENNSWVFKGQHSYCNMILLSIYSSDIDIYSINSGEIFFQGAPQIVEQVTIPAIQQVEEIPQAMSEVLRILIPVGLIVLSIGLVIFLMRLVISRLA